MMIRNLPLYIGLRYTRAKRRHQFISFISAFSLVGMALGVLSLIVVLSVMNGFELELKQRLLNVIPHGFVKKSPEIVQWQALSQQVDNTEGVIASAPFVESFTLLSNGRAVEGGQVHGIQPQWELKTSDIEKHMLLGSLQDLQPGEYGIIVGRLMANFLGLTLGDRLVLTLPQVSITPAGVFPRQKRFTLVGVFEVGAQVDHSMALIHLQDAQKLLRIKGVQGLHVRTEDIFSAGQILERVADRLSDSYQVSDWSSTQGSLFQAIKMEKRVVGLMLMVIIAVAAFNIISSLVLMVADKRADIAVLRTLGLSSRQIMGVFMIQGSAIGIIGTLTGLVLGTLVAFYIGDIVSFIEQFSGLRIFDPAVYYISKLPSDWQWQDAALVTVAALFLSVLATVYPAYRAAKIAPAEALRYE